MSKNTIIWDLSGTLFRPSSEHLSPTELEDASFLFLMWSGKKTASRLDSLVHKLLSNVISQQETDPSQVIRDHTGKEVPEIICSFLAGRLNSLQAKEQALAFYESWAPENIKSEDQIQVRRMIETFFNPQVIASCVKPIEEAVILFKKTLETGKNVYILSNWDQDSFALFYEKYKESIFKDLGREHIVISADTGFVKPQRGIYTWLLATNNLDPHDCLFIDDQEENIAEALKQGIEGIQFKKNALEQIEKALREQTIL